MNNNNSNNRIVDFTVPADHRIKLKESENKNKYLNLARELKTLWNMKVTIIPIVIGAFGTVTKGLLKRPEDLEVGGWVETIKTTTLLRTARILRRVLETEDLEVGGWVETIKTTTLLRTARILRRVLETWGDLLSLKLQWKTIS